ncbi:MAG: T9SS type A sorting domain-containing protein [Fibrobacteres bacterium]|nr:T9SS type A sorting domain-containing protein [Fibrobacterota bacterium]
MNNYFTRRVTCFKDSVFSPKCNILYHGWGYADTTSPSTTTASNFRIPGELARLFYFTGDTVFERKMNTFAMDGKNGIFRQWDHGFGGKYDMTVFQPYLFYLNNKSNYRKNPIIDWTYTESTEDPVLDGEYINGSSLTAAPNPFNPMVTIKFTGAAYGTDPQKAIRLSVISSDGRVVYTENTTVGAAAKGIVWSGKDTKGKTSSTGVYFVKAEYSGKSIVKKLTMVR